MTTHEHLIRLLLFGTYAFTEKAGTVHCLPKVQSVLILITTMAVGHEDKQWLLHWTGFKISWYPDFVSIILSTWHVRSQTQTRILTYMHIQYCSFSHIYSWRALSPLQLPPRFIHIFIVENECTSNFTFPFWFRCSIILGPLQWHDRTYIRDWTCVWWVGSKLRLLSVGQMWANWVFLRCIWWN